MYRFSDQVEGLLFEGNLDHSQICTPSKCGVILNLHVFFDWLRSAMWVGPD